MAKKDTCLRGHARTPDNLTKPLWGACKLCLPIRSKARMAKGRCIHGHTKSPENTTPEGYCKPCKNTHLQERYGISIEQFNKLMEKQENRCAVCRTVFSKTCKPRVDHKHDGSANARGLLCHGCNVGLGYFKENIEALIAAANYIKETQWNPQFIASSLVLDSEQGLEKTQLQNSLSKSVATSTV